MRFLICIVLCLLWCSTVKSQQQYINPLQDKIVAIDSFSTIYTTKDKLCTAENVLHHKFITVDNHNFSLTDNIYWIKYCFNNTSKDIVDRYLFFPYHHINNIDAYEVVHENIVKITETGTRRNYNLKTKASRGYPIALELKPGKTTVLIKLQHLNLPLRGTSYLLNQKQMDTIVIKNNSTIWFWRGAFIFALFFAIVLYRATKLKLFLYYFILNVGVMLFIGMEIGDYFLVFESDSNNFIIDIKHLGNLIVITFFPLFLNELTPISKLHPKLWKSIFISISIAVLGWAICLIPQAKSSIFLYYVTYYLIIITGFIFLLQLIFLLHAAIKKKKNSVTLLILYFLYIGAVSYNVILPNLGIKTDDVLVYNSLLYGSIIEIFSFLLIMGKETLNIYKDREALLINQKSHQKNIIKAVVESQEIERNKVGAELHDMIGGNISFIKQATPPEQKKLHKVIDDTINAVRMLSHGLMTPKVNGDQFADEIKDLCLLTSQKSLKVDYYFHNWTPLLNKNNATHLYRIVQELLQNALKHSKATQVHIQFFKNENTLTFVYEDNGIGFCNLNPTKGRGLISIHNRVQLINGSIKIETSPNNGVYVFIEATDG